MQDGDPIGVILATEKPALLTEVLAKLPHTLAALRSPKPTVATEVELSWPGKPKDPLLPPCFVTELA